MKSKIFRVLGVVSLVSMLVGLLPASAPVLADVSNVYVDLPIPSCYSGGFMDAIIGKRDANYPVFMTLGHELWGAIGQAFTEPNIGDTVTITASAATDEAKLTITTGSVSVVMSGAGTYNAATGVLTFTAALETATVTSTVASTTGIWKRVTGLPTAVAGGTATLASFASCGDTITITLPMDTTVASSVTATISASSGLAGSPPFLTTAILNNVMFTGDSGNRVITATLGESEASIKDVIGSGSQVKINITAGITNPSTAGTYQLTVYTSQETTPVLSAPYNILNPLLCPLPGIVSGYNSADVLIVQSMSISTVVNTSNVVKIVVGPGSYDYDEDVVLNSTTLTSIEATDGAAITIIKDTNTNGVGGTLTVTATPAEGLTIDGLTIWGREGATSITIAPGTNVTIKNCIVQGTGTTGINIAGGTTVIDTCTLTGLIPALNITGATACTIKNSTIDGCGSAATSTPAINITGATQFDAFNNVFYNSPYFIGNVAGGTARFIFNDFSIYTGNARGFIQSGGTIALQHNWWGQSTGAATGFNDTTISATTESNLPLGAAPTAGYITNAAWSTNATATGYVTMPSVTIASGISLLGAATFTSCPATSAPISSQAVVRYYDVFLNPAGTLGANDTATIYFYSVLTSCAKVLYWDATLERWDMCYDQVTNYDGKYVAVILSTTTSPPLSDVIGSYFVLLDGCTEIGPPISLVTPAQGAKDVAVDVTFKWAVVDGAIGYDFAIAEERGQTDKFGVVDFNTTAIANTYKLTTSLKYNTQYWWRVGAVSADGVRGNWMLATFTTEKEPAVVTPTTITVTITYPPPTTVTITLPPYTGLSSYLSWIVIAIVVVMVAAAVVLIVLITKPRRNG